MQRNEKTKALRAQISKLVEEYAAIALASNTFVPGTTMVPPLNKLIDAIELKIWSGLTRWLAYFGRFNFKFETKLATFLALNTNHRQLRLISQPRRVQYFDITKLGERAIKPGDEVIGVAAGFPTTVNPSCSLAAYLCLSTSTRSSRIDAGKIEATISPKTKA